MKVLARSRYGAAKNCSGWARSDRQRPAAGAVAAGHSFWNRPTIIDFAITRVAKRSVPTMLAQPKNGGHGAKARLCPPYKSLPTLPSRQLIGKIPDGLAIDGGPVPLAHRLEIGGAFAIGRAVLEAGGVQQIGGGGQYVRDAVAQIDMAVAVEIDAVFDVGRRQELGLSDFAGESADQSTQGEIAALQDFQRREQFALEQLRAPAIMRHGGEGADHRHLADVALAEIALQPPDGDHDLRRHPELLLDPRQQRGVPLQ